MPFNERKSEPFKGGAYQLRASDLNKLRNVPVRRISGSGDTDTSYYGDRLVISSKSINPQLPDVRRYLQQFVVLEELDDVLVCVPFTQPDDGIWLVPQLYNPALGTTQPYAIFVAKPYDLQRTPWDTQTVTINGNVTIFTYTGVGQRTASVLGVDTPQIIIPNYFPGDVIMAAYAVTGYNDTNGTPICWLDVNNSARIWTPPCCEGSSGSVSINYDGSFVGSRPTLNFIDNQGQTSGGTLLTITDDVFTDAVNIAIGSATAAGNAGNLQWTDGSGNFFSDDNINRFHDDGGGLSFNSYQSLLWLTQDNISGTELNLQLNSRAPGDPLLPGGTAGSALWLTRIPYYTDPIGPEDPVGYIAFGHGTYDGSEPAVCGKDAVLSASLDGTGENSLLMQVNNIYDTLQGGTLSLAASTIGLSYDLLSIGGYYGGLTPSIVINGSPAIGSTFWDGSVFTDGLLTTFGSPTVGGDLTGSLPDPILIDVGPGAGIYTLGLASSPLGMDGTITLDSNGRVTAVQQVS